MTLFIFHASTCAGCKVALPELEAVRSKRHDFVVIYRQIDAARYADERDVVLGFRPRATPAYAVTHGEQLIATHTGVMKRAQLDKWLDEAKATVEEDAAAERARGVAALGAGSAAQSNAAKGQRR